MRSLELFKELKNRRQIGNVELSLGYLRSKRGEMEMALEHFIRSADSMDKIGNLVGSATALLAKGRSYADIGRYHEAEISLLSALNNFKEMEMDRKVVATLVSLISVLLDGDNSENVHDYIEQAQEIAQRNHFSSDEAKVLKLQGHAYRLEGKEKESNEKYKASYELFKELKREKDAQAVKKEWESKE